MRSQRRRHGIISQAEQDAALDREDAILRVRRLQPARPSTSTPLARCATCGQWPRMIQTVAGALCTGDGGPGHPYLPASNRKLQRMGEQ